MARADPHTLLSLDRYAAIIGISPAHFNTAIVGNCFPASSSCDDVWWQYSWQSGDRASRQELAEAIFEAEELIADTFGYYPAPRWIAGEVHKFPRHHRKMVTQFGGLNVYGQRKSVQANWKKVVTAGRRATSAVGTATTGGGTLVYSDADGDGCTETATITLPTSLTDACEIKAYFPSESGDQEWEIRPARTKTISGGNVVMTFWTWQMILPSLWEAFPRGGSDLDTIDAGNTANLITSVDVAREFTDGTQASAQLSWETSPRNTIVFTTCSTCGGDGCSACSFTTQDGCLHVRNNDLGIVVPQPANYDASTEQWNQVAFSVCRDPDLAKIWYLAGDIDKRFLSGQSCDQLSQKWAQAIAWLATARLRRPTCNCSSRITEELRIDLALTNQTQSYQVPFEDLRNPFGTRLGEVRAWRNVYRLARQIDFGGGAV